MAEKITFEQAMAELEKIVGRLETGDIPLEEALSMYKKGMEYSKFCHDQLKNAEEQLTKVLTDHGEEDFHLQEEEQD
ncbi:exodeoxyribonuclease VII small subunit [Lederbergia sp. NSJ-179]|uniref:exodeoxyribonuclease VII small subunit n=1 Tax=Lederbergia sp. NSJ-179 TaxID=2931402 RepID=UPI001FCFBC98|nr:exodeoxyribonuclease VII small subunit [Lederbergia sp. NSJ-179]MCJ7839360.1 exodeoxyribonuclease VII small subunit [Lederbergia sp. NSJ-179]